MSRDARTGARVDGNDDDDNPRARRRRRHRDDARREVIAAAWAIADDEGIGAVSLSDVARRVGMRAPSLYNYFESRLAIIDAMFQESAEQFRAAVTATPELSDPRDALRALGRAFLEFAQARPARFELLFHRPVPGFFPTEPAYTPAIEADALVSARLERAGLGVPVFQAFCRAAMIGIANQQIANPLDPELGLDVIDVAVDVVLGMAEREAGA